MSQPLETPCLDELPLGGKRSDWLGRIATAIKPRADDTAYMQASSAALMEGPRSFTHWILWSTFLFLILALTWAGLAKVDEVTVGEGKVIPSNQVQVVQNPDGGVVSEILVRVGEVVQKDQPLMRIDDTRFSASYKEGQAKDDALIARIARLKAEAGGTPFLTTRRAEGIQGDKFFAEEQNLFESRQRELQASLAVLRQQADQRRQELAEKRSREAQLLQSYALVSKELAMTRPLAQKGVVSDVELLRLEREANDLAGELSATRLSLPRLDAAYREARQKIDEMSAHFRADAMKDLNQAGAEQAALSAANTALEDRVVHAVVRAPVAGVVKQIKLNTVGGVAQPGMELMEIVPLEDTLLIEARVRPADVAYLHLGQEAMVKLSAYDYSIFGGFPATLEHISADTLIPEKPGEKPEPYYRILVRTQQNKPSGRSDSVPILPGMVATVDIRTGQKTVLHYLLKPIIKTKDVALRER
ncbi:HlyD family type I secretion periplasmic adaptor subunit [Cupriavidus lacunae]|uniref:Membrane fusion protein (MFP) family protein n=1 Tax=Cupriavidus lacunae TaxID=2666307 RepID=A0A370MY67_9BURK|nr:HlyD family type I secretion periplasmic adaptor subunit [Cupriavidus lacunae]RDJ98137.1 HlyD family type I secretion periplasmic adaptor subunit [Cupriavidus lacunae]